MALKAVVNPETIGICIKINLHFSNIERQEAIPIKFQFATKLTQ